jgi:hypothetical protein
VLYVRQENSDKPKQQTKRKNMSEEKPTLEELFMAEEATLISYYRKLANAKLFLDADFNKIPENERFNRYKEYNSEMESTKIQIIEQYPRVIAARDAILARNRQ